LHADLLTDNNRTQIMGQIIGYTDRYARDLAEVAADIGGGGNYFNKDLRDEHRLPVRDVNFNSEKEAAVAPWNLYNDAGDTVIPSEFFEFIHQVRNWKRKNGTIVKGNDHLCDMAVCYFAKFIDRLGIRRIRVVPQTFSTGGSIRSDPSGTSVTVTRRKRFALPVARPFGNSSKRP